MNTDADDEADAARDQGWHLDPEGSGFLRWWTGRQWTETFRPNDRFNAEEPHEDPDL